jgi:hypothetical protein
LLVLRHGSRLCTPSLAVVDADDGDARAANASPAVPLAAARSCVASAK